MERQYIVNGRFLSRKITGVERYAIEILNELDKLIKPGELQLAVPIDANLPIYKNIKIVKVGHLKNILWEHISFPIYALKNKLVPLNFCNVAPLIYPGVVFVHDVKVKAKPEFFDWKFRLWYKILFANIAKRASKIVTVSEFSKKEICKYMKVNPAKVDVIPSAWSHFERIEEDENALNKYGLKAGNYYFSMSSLEPNKNFKWIAEVAKKYPNYLFAVAGSINNKVFSDGLGFECPENMKLLGYVSDGEAKCLMHNCKAFMFPTIYEGFGLPPLEAIGSGCKSAVISDTEVMYEIYGECGTYVNPMKYEFDEKDLKVIEELQKDKLLNKFTWGGSAMLLQTLLQLRG